MQRMFFRILAIALLMSPAAYGQSLGDVARENHDKKQSEDVAGTAPKVIRGRERPVRVAYQPVAGAAGAACGATPAATR